MDNTLIIGDIGSGKSQSLVMPEINEILKEQQNKVGIGLTVFDPHGETAKYTQVLAEKSNLPYILLKPNDTNITDTFNVLSGDTKTVSEMLTASITEQYKDNKYKEPFFAELFTRHITTLVKQDGDTTLKELLEVMKDKNEIVRLANKINEDSKYSYLTYFVHRVMFGRYEEEFKEVRSNVILLLEHALSEEGIVETFSKGNTFDLKGLMDDAGILIIDTSTTQNDLIRKLMLMQVQEAVFTKKKKSEPANKQRIIVENITKHINADLDVFLSLSRTYNTSVIYTAHSVKSLEDEVEKFEKNGMTNIILSNIANKVLFTNTFDLEREYERIFGNQNINVKQSIIRLRNGEAEGISNETVNVESLSNLPPYHFIYQFRENDILQPIRIGKGELVNKVKGFE